MHTTILRQYVFAMPAMRATATAGLWLQRIATRRRLRELDSRELEDIGCTAQERRRECAKWFWKA